MVMGWRCDRSDGDGGDAMVVIRDGDGAMPIITKGMEMGIDI